MNSLIGPEISKRRKLAGLSQKDFAAMLKMKGSQLCKIEKGINIPTATTLKRIESCLGLDYGTLLALRKQALLTDAAGKPSSPATGLDRFRPTCRDEHSISTEDLTSLASILDARLDLYIQFEDMLKLKHVCLLGLNELKTSTSEDGIIMAEFLRERLHVGNAPLRSFLPLLERHNVRIVFLEDLPPLGSGRQRAGFAFHDATYDMPVICVNDAAPSTTQLYEIAYHLGEWLQFRFQESVRRNTKLDSSWFCRAFAATFLMPTAMLRDYLDVLNINDRKWTDPLIEQIARLFGVSPMALVYRLQSIGRISPAQADKLISRIREAGNASAFGGFAPTPPLPHDTWLNLLRARAERSR